jgi:hypothetical protein
MFNHEKEEEEIYGFLRYIVIGYISSVWARLLIVG